MRARQAQAEEAAAALLRGVNLPGVQGNAGTTTATAKVGLYLLMLQWPLLQCLPQCIW